MDGMGLLSGLSLSDTVSGVQAYVVQPGYVIQWVCLIHWLNFERRNFEWPNSERPNFERLNFERLNFERPNFERPNFERPNFERPNFERAQLQTTEVRKGLNFENGRIFLHILFFK